MLSFVKNNFSAILLFSFITILLSYSWFSEGKMLAKAEEEIPLYNIERTLDFSRHNWNDTGMGRVNILEKASLPFYYSLKLLKDIGFSSVEIQRFTFSIIIFLTFLSTYLLSFELSDGFKNRSLVGVVSSLFYFFNPYAALNVWYRFLYPHILALPLLPLSLFIYLRALKEEKFSMHILLIVVMTVFSYVFNSPAFILIIWLPILIAWTFYVYKKRKNIKKNITSILHLPIAITIWVIVNIWWLSDLANIRDSAVGNVTSETSIKTLQSLSRFYTLPYITRLHSLDFFQDFPWGKIYGGLPLLLLSWLPFVIVLLTLFYLRKNINIKLIAFFLMISLFISKGSSPPLGKIFEFFFVNISPLQLLRNTFEKSGLILSLSYALLIGFGIGNIFSHSKKILAILVVFLIVVVYPLPLWNGKIFYTHNKSIATEVPGYYKDVNSFVKSKIGNFRIIQLPAVYSDGSIYKWSNSYFGGDPAHYLYDYPVISRNINDGYFENVYKEYLKSVSYTEQWKTAGLFSSKYIVLNGDIDSDKLTLPSIEVFKEYLSKINKPGGKISGICNLKNKTLPIDCELPEESSNFYKFSYLKIVLSQKVQSNIEVQLTDSANSTISWALDPNSSTYEVPLFDPDNDVSWFLFDRVKRLRISSGSVDDLPSIHVIKLELEEGKKVSQRNLQFTKQFGNLYLYSLDEKVITPRIYAPTEIINVESVRDMFSSISTTDKLIKNKSYIISGDKKNVKDNYQTPDIYFVSNSPERYEVSVSNAKEPFILVLNNTYNPGWKALVDNKEQQHFVINGLSNGYLVNIPGSVGKVILQFE